MRTQKLNRRLVFSLLRDAFLVLAALLAMITPLAAQQPEPPAPVISGYVIDAELDPASHHLAATVVVSFTASETAEPGIIAPVSFGLHPALKVTKISDGNGKQLTGERLADGILRVTPAAPFVRGQLMHWTFQYEGVITGNGVGPGSPGKDLKELKLAAIEEPISYLLYPARWFPTTNYLTGRFTAKMHIRMPQGVLVFSSGSQGAPKPVRLANGKPGEQYDFNWTKSGFPGTVIAGRYLAPETAGAGNVQVYLTASHQKSASDLAQIATKEYEFFTASFGAPESNHLNVVELPDDAMPSAWAPELAAISGSRMGDSSGVRLLANTIARQWWGSEVSPHSLDDAWITNGMARYSELMYLENEGGKSALRAALPDVAAGALASDTVPLSSASRLSPLSPEFQLMTLEKGAMIFHMLRWELGDKDFLATLKRVLSQYAGSSIRATELDKAAEAESELHLSSFFAQWTDGAGAPQFTSKYAVYRLGNNKGFRTIGEIDQDLDLFRMPIELSVETEGKTETQKIDVAGASTPFVVDTFGRPRRISIDPQDWVLKSTPGLQVRVALLRGQQRVAEGNLAAALTEYQKALEINAQSSLVSYRIGDLLFAQRNYQASANAYRDALRGDGEPHWIEVWSHIQLGKIFDATSQRERAVNEYRLAVQTNDNSQGAVNEARQYLQKPYVRPEKE